jgi:hypothetical protein
MNMKQSCSFLPARLTHLLVTLLFALAVPSFAQFNASLSGTVQDPTGAAIPNATLTLTNLGNQQTQTATSSAQGSYRFGELPPEHYKLAVTAPGFKSSTYADIQLAAETPRDLPVVLSAGEVTEAITVNASEAPALQTADASIGSTIDSEAIQRLPIVGGNPYELLRTAPGVTGDGARAGNGTAVFLPNGAGPGGSSRGIFQTENQTQISADGQRVADNNYTVDGVSVNSLTHGGAAVVTPNQEAIGQITVLSTSYDAADGRNSGAQIKVVTRSGTNTLHGSLYFLYDEPGLNAYAKYGGPDGQKPLRTPIKQRAYDASLGGPLWRDKLFGFASFAGFGLTANSVVTQYVETPQFRSQVTAQRPGSIATQIVGSAGVTPRVLNVLPLNCSIYANNQGMYAPKGGVTQTAAGGPYCNPVAGGVDIGSPTAGGASQIGVYVPSFSSATANYVGGGLDGVPDIEYAQLLVPTRSRGRQFNGRVDWYVTQKDQFAGSFYLTKLDSNGISGTTDSRPQSDLPFKPINIAATLIYIHTFSSAWLNELRGNGTRFADNGLRDAGTTVNFGIPYINIQGLPFSNNVQYGVSQNSTSPALFAENTYEVRDQVTHTWGSHALKLGGEIRFEQDNDNLSGNNRPVYAVQGLWNFANDAPIFEGITASTITGGPTNSQLYLRSKDIAAYIQHDWKLTPTFTLNTGFRYEIYTPISNKTGNVSKPVLGPPGSELSGMTLVPTHDLYNTDYGHYAPKIGFAWVPSFYNGNVVLRGGFAIAYNHLDAALFNTQAVDNVPGAAYFNVCCGTSSLDFGTPLAAGQIKYSLGTSNSPNSFPANPSFAKGVNAKGFPNGGAQIEVYGVGGTIKNPMSYLYSFETETQLPYRIVTTAGYAGSIGRHYARLVNQNFLYDNTNSPVYASYFAQTDSVQSYNALNVRVSRQMQHGFQIDANYTFSKSLDQVSNGDGANSNANQTNPVNNKSEYGPSDYDTRNRVTISALYQSPKVHSDNFLVKAVANGWQANTIFTAHSGFPYTPVTYNLQTTGVQGAAVVGPTRPLGILTSAGTIGTNCSNNAFKTGSNFPNRGPGGTLGGSLYFNTTKPTLAPGQNYIYTPGIGRNSFTGPCYRDVDISVAKQVEFGAGDHAATLRFQANFFNAFNLLNLTPITNGNANPAANIQNADFGKATGADAGRQIEFLVRLNF